MAILTASSGGGSRSRIKNNDELPPKGKYIATCIGIGDQYGVERKKFESDDVEKVDLTAFYFGYKCKEGRPWAVKSRDMKISLHERAALHKFLKEWLGEAPSVGLDTATLVGRGAEIRVEHVPSTRTPGRFFANLQVCLPVDSDDAGKIKPVDAFKGLLHEAVSPDTDNDEMPF